MKVAIVYWSGTGHTEAIMNLVKKGVEQAGGEADVYMPWDFEPSKMGAYTNFAFGCPAMGDEQLETEDFQPMWDQISDDLKGKNVVLFGSYNWNSGEYMDDWAQDAVRAQILFLTAWRFSMHRNPVPMKNKRRLPLA